MRNLAIMPLQGKERMNLGEYAEEVCYPEIG